MTTPLRHTVQPGVRTALAVTTEPNSQCELTPADNPDAPVLRAYSDDAGVARFHVQPDRAADTPANLVLHTLGADRQIVSRRPIELRSAVEATENHPFPAAETPLALRSGSTHRPALTVAEAMDLSHQDALAGGFPIRPGFDETPAALEAWLRNVTTPMVRIDPHVLASPDVRHGGIGTIETAGPSNAAAAVSATSNTTFSNWSGYERRRNLQFATVLGGPVLTEPIGPDRTADATVKVPIGGGVHLSPPYDWISAEWNVPAVTGPINQQGWSAYWVGLDGDGTTDLVQAGTEQNAIHYDFFFLNLNVSTFWAWTEFLPQQPTEQVISNFPIKAGDRIYCEVSMGDAGASPSLPGAFGRFLIMNLTQGAFASIDTPRGSTSVGGGEAVWIMERPTVNGSLPALANYGSTTMNWPTCRQANAAAGQGFLPYLGGNNVNGTMTNNSNTLSTATAVDANNLRFDWHAFL